MHRSQEHGSFLRLIQHSASAKQRQCLIKYSSRSQILALAEVVTNYLAGNLKLKTEENFVLYSKHRRLFRVLGFRGRKSWLKRKQAALTLGKVLSLFLSDTLDAVV